VMLALPGSAYLYQGEELGLPEVTDLPPESRQDPTWFRTHHEKYGRDGCRVPIPWEADAPSYGFGPTDASWLPQPAQWAELARDRQEGVPGSTLELYRTLLALRAQHSLGLARLEWLPGYDADVVAFRAGDVTVIANAGGTPVELPTEGEILVASADVVGGVLEPDTTVWIA
jgi:alpha-glucosidase